MAEGAAELLECVSASVLLRRDDATLEVVAVSGTIPDSVAGFVLPMESLGGVVTRTGEPRTWMEGEEDSLAGRPEAFQNAGIRDCMFVPLNGSHETFGALAVCNRRAAGRYTDEEMELLQTLATRAATAIETSRLNDALQRRVAEATALAEVGRAVTGTLSLEEVLQREFSIVVQNLVANAIDAYGGEAGVVRFAAGAAPAVRRCWRWRTAARESRRRSAGASTTISSPPRTWGREPASASPWCTRS